VARFWGAGVNGTTQDDKKLSLNPITNNIFVSGTYSDSNVALFHPNTSSNVGFTIPIPSNNASAVFVSDYTTSGFPQWIAAVGGSNSSVVKTDIFTNANDNIYLTGNYSNDAPVVYSANGGATLPQASVGVDSTDATTSAFIMQLASPLTPLL